MRKSHSPERRRLARKKRRDTLIDALGGVCIDCGSSSKLEFDHVIPADKSFEIATSLERKLETILTELQKCQLLCRVCHTKKTHLDNGHGLGGEHGLPGTYSNYGCRCELCTEVWRISCIKYRKKIASLS